MGSRVESVIDAEAAVLASESDLLESAETSVVTSCAISDVALAGVSVWGSTSTAGDTAHHGGL
jgi:hypothetical protein|tara:strand:+ start:4463 stop:4651 length:189 start_codon:yes stop_codon:yes gene_type:complete